MKLSLTKQEADAIGINLETLDGLASTAKEKCYLFMQCITNYYMEHPDCLQLEVQ